MKTKDLNLQSKTVVQQLMANRNMSEEQAMAFWFNSETFKEIRRKELSYISGMRAYWELELEIKKDPRWMDDPFE